jgi:hypothetical protein
MTQEEKQLLLKDLCARLPYGVILDTGTKLRSIDILTQIVSGIGTDRKVENIKYYLRPMSSMTDEEKKEYCDLQEKFLYSSRYPVTDAYELFDWLSAHHFDYRGLIEKGLALEAPEEMYKTE